MEVRNRTFRPGKPAGFRAKFTLGDGIDAVGTMRPRGGELRTRRPVVAKWVCCRVWFGVPFLPERTDLLNTVRRHPAVNDRVTVRADRPQIHSRIKGVRRPDLG